MNNPAMVVILFFIRIYFAGIGQSDVYWLLSDLNRERPDFLQPLAFLSSRSIACHLILGVRNSMRSLF